MKNDYRSTAAEAAEAVGNEVAVGVAFGVDVGVLGRC